MPNTNSQLLQGLMIAMMALAVAGITLVFGYHWPDRSEYLVGIPLGLVVLLLAIVYPQVAILALVALVPMDTLAYLAGVDQGLTITKVLFPFTLAGLLIGRLIGRFEAPAPNIMDRWVLLWITLNIVLVITATDTDMALRFVRRLISMGLLYYVLSRSFLEATWNRRLHLTLIGAAMASVIVGIVSYFAGTNPFIKGYEFDVVRITGAAHISPNFYAITLALPMMLAMSLAFTADSGVRRRLYTGLMILMLVGVGLTFSRSGFLAVTATILAGLVLWRKMVSPKQWLFVGILMLVSLVFMPSEFWERISTLNVFGEDGAVDESLAHRFNYILVGMNILRENPLTGAGPGNYQVLHAMAEYQTIPGMIGVERLPHNMYLQAVTETGLIGIFMLSGMLLAALIHVSRAVRRHDSNYWLAAALLASLCGYLVMGLFSHQILNKYLWVLLAMIRMLPVPPAKPAQRTMQ